MSKDIKPDYRYLDAKLSISNPNALKMRILDKCNPLNMEEMANDVKPFHFEISDTKKVERFADLARQYSFE